MVCIFRQFHYSPQELDCWIKEQTSLTFECKNQYFAINLSTFVFNTSHKHFWGFNIAHSETYSELWDFVERNPFIVRIYLDSNNLLHFEVSGVLVLALYERMLPFYEARKQPQICLSGNSCQEDPVKGLFMFFYTLWGSYFHRFRLLLQSTLYLLFYLFS